MLKKLTRQGNSAALIIDKTLMGLMQIDEQTPLKLTVRGRKLIVEPLPDEEREARFEKVLKRTSKRNTELFRRLAR